MEPSVTVGASVFRDHVSDELLGSSTEQSDAHGRRFLCKYLSGRLSVLDREFVLGQLVPDGTY